ncbi:MAG: ABC transporter ATP-binding protein [Betaproteobacteria bacterium]|nr:ABC transporter ATP-binding protein [Betaproteobacteria bacterium]
MRNLVAGYGGKVAVDNISFSVATGEHLSLLGPSGCGKSTTLRCIAGLETPFEGEIAIGGNVVYSSKDRINLPPEKRNLAMVFQSYAIWPHMSVFENVAYGLRIKGPRGEQLNEQVYRALEMVGMREFADRQATDLSGGQQQRVALARALCGPPPGDAARRAAVESRRAAADAHARRAQGTAAADQPEHDIRHA